MYAKGTTTNIDARASRELGDWFAAGTGWGTYGARIALQPCGSEPAMLPHAQDLLSLATFAWARGEALPADQAQPLYLRDNVATPKQPL